MDAELEQRWRAGMAPFDGVTLFVAEILRPPALRLALLAVIGRLKVVFPEARLFRLKDWHQHDGYVTRAEPTRWEELESWCATEETLYAAQAGDTYVRVGVFPEDRTFYFRFYVEEHTSFGPQKGLSYHEGDGDFDLTGSPDLVEAVAAALRERGMGGLETAPAREFFDARYAG